MRLAAWATGPQGPSEEAVLTAQRHDADTAAPASQHARIVSSPPRPRWPCTPAPGLDDAWLHGSFHPFPRRKASCCGSMAFGSSKKPTVYIIDGGNGIALGRPRATGHATVCQALTIPLQAEVPP